MHRTSAPKRQQNSRVQRHFRHIQRLSTGNPQACPQQLQPTNGGEVVESFATGQMA
jgi:hypothetical protein